MATLQTFKFTEIVSNIAAAVQGGASALVDFSVGSVLRAVAEATAGVVLWLQAIILQLLTITRASTSQGADLDSWMGDFSFPRLPASAATGAVTFSRFTATQQALIPAGATIQSADGARDFAVTIDAANPAWNAGLDGYVIAENTASVAVPVRAALAGSGGNVQAGSITVITTPIPGVDTVTNASGFANGIDAESDAAYRARFRLYIAGLSKATKGAIGSAIADVKQGIDFTITENQNYDGATDMGYFYVVIDDGTGEPSDDLQASVASAIEAVRPIGSRFGVFAPATVAASVAMTITSAPGFDHATVVGDVGTSLRNFINGLRLGVGLPYTQLASIAYDVAGVKNATSILLNGGTSDLTASPKQKLLAGSVTIA